MAKRFSAVVVGAGGISRAWFGPLKQEKVDVRAVVDLDADRAAAAIAKYELDAEASDDFAAVLKRTQPDFVVDLTVPEAHAAITCTALAAGCHVIGEKPMASSMAEARRMVRAARKAGKLYMVSQSRRWEAPHEQIRRLIQRGRLGRLTTVNCDFYIGAHFGGFRAAMESPLVLDMSIHHFDLARMFTGLDAQGVYCHEFNPHGSWYAGDVAATCVFELADGVVFTYRGSWCAEGFPTSWHGNWRIVGEKGSVLYENDQPPRAEVVTPRAGQFILPGKPVKMPAASMKYKGMHGALREMLAYLRTGRQPQTHCEDNIQSLAMVFGAMESSRKGRRVAVRAM